MPFPDSMLRFNSSHRLQGILFDEHYGVTLASILQTPCPEYQLLRTRSTSSASPFCFTYTYTDIGSSILGCTTAQTVISVQIFANFVQPSAPSISNSAAISNSSPIQNSGFSSLPLWVTTIFTPPPSTPIPTGPVTASALSSDTIAPASGPLAHVGAITAGVIGSVAAILVTVGVALYFCLRSKKHRS
jgi:hypothetical protein